MKHAVQVLAVLLVVLNAALIVPALAEHSQILVIASIVTALVLLIASFARIAPAAPAARPAVADAAKPAPAAATPKNQAQAEILTLLGVFQEKGRFIDFLMEDISPHSDADVGSVARTVHQGCKAVLAEHFHIEPISPEGEGAAITVPAGYTADEFRLVGNLSGGAPFTGTVVHKGWRATSVKLPRVINPNGDRLPAIAPAQVEVR